MYLCVKHAQHTIFGGLMYDVALNGNVYRLIKWFICGGVYPNVYTRMKLHTYADMNKMKEVE